MTDRSARSEIGLSSVRLNMKMDPENPREGLQTSGTVTCVLVVRGSSSLIANPRSQWATPSDGLKAAMSAVAEHPEDTRCAVLTVERHDLAEIEALLDAIVDLAPHGCVAANLGTVELARRSIPYEWQVGLVGNVEVAGQVERVYLLRTAGWPRSERANYYQDLFVGRTDELQELRTRMELVRVVCVTGAPGVGKTSLIRRYANEFSGGEESSFLEAFEVDLADIKDPALVLPALQRVVNPLRMPEESLLDSLVASLRDRRVLLVFDHVEHVRQEVARIAEVLAPRTRDVGIIIAGQVIATPRGAARLPISGLTFPRQDEIVSDAHDFDAVRLFVDRAALADPHFHPRNHDLVSIGKLVRLLDGNPLAIELAATKIRALDATAILNRMNLKLALLKDDGSHRPARHQSIAKALETVFDLISPGARSLILRLSVLRGAFSVSEATDFVREDRGLDSAKVESAFLELLDASLLTPSTVSHSSKRFYLGELVRDYAFQELKAAREDLTWQKRHRAHVIRLLDEGERGIRSQDQLVWIERIDAAYEDIRQVILADVRVAKNAEVALHGIIFTLAQYWLLKSYYSEGLSLIESVIASPEARQSSLYPRLLNTACMISIAKRDFRKARQYAWQCNRSSRKAGNELALAYSRSNLAIVAQLEGRVPRMLRHAERSSHVFRRLGDRGSLLTILCLVMRPMAMTDPTETMRIIHEADQLAAQVQNPIYTALVNHNAADALYLCGEHLRALGRLHACLTHYLSTQANANIAGSIRTAAHIFWKLDDWENAAYFYGAAEYLHQNPELDIQIEPSIAAAWSELGMRLSLRLGESHAWLSRMESLDNEYILRKIAKYSIW